MDRTNGGPAFPGGTGMSLREWFAGQALAGIAESYWDAPDLAAKKAYELADAMLAERGK